ncbi:MAG TPA: hypothetical protein PLA68_02520, partial [Panacibacter sp.]|nr:hypothetical protein [Panacibacter sp.]
MLLIYTTHITNRLQYAVDTLFEQVTNITFQLTDDQNFYKNSNADCKINYSSTKILDTEFWVQPHGLLFENNIQQQKIQCFEWNNLKVFFRTNGDLPFDIFAASFYLITRYEEYLPHTLDEYGRYAHTNSLAFKEGFLQLPLVNLWMRELLKLLQQKFTLFTIHLSPFTFLPTYDIDIAYAYLHKPLLNNIGGFCKELISGKWKQFAERAGVLFGFIKDPFVTYDWLDALHEMYNLQPVYFFLIAAQRKGCDKNISPRNKYMQRLMRWNSRKYATGIHPSWQSGDNTAILNKEILLFQKIIGKPAITSRQHYIRMNLPGTYRLLSEHGIVHEYSMGYGSINGFRASVASPFYW